MRITRQKDIFANANRHYSLRKLSVGLASVLIGLSFANATKIQTVKADSLNKVPVYLRGNENTVQNEMQQFSSVQNSVAEQPQKDLHDDLSKQRTSMQPNDHAEVQENKLADQSNNKLTNNTSTDSKEDLGQNKVAPDGTKRVSIDKNDAEKSIIGSSSTQQTNNQSNYHAEDNSQTQLNITKNSQPLNLKILATNLTQDNLTQDISKITDPSKIDASHFADGTHWTPAGWTRADKDTKTVKSSRLTMQWQNTGNINSKTNTYDDQAGDWAFISPKQVKFTIDKNDLKQGNPILIASIQQIPTQGEQSLARDQVPDLSSESWGSQGYAITDSQTKQQIGHLGVWWHDSSELDLVFTADKTIDNLAVDPTFTYTWTDNKIGFATNLNSYGDASYGDGTMYSYKNHLKYPLHYSIVSNSQVLNYDIDFKDRVHTKESSAPSNASYTNDFWNNFTYTQYIDSNQSNPQEANDPSFVVQVSPITGKYTQDNLNNTSVRQSYHVYAYDANGKLTDMNIDLSAPTMHFTNAGENLNSTDLWNATAKGKAMYSAQSDGSVLLCVKPATFVPNKDAIKQALEGSYFTNVQDPEHRQQIIDNTINNTRSWGRDDMIVQLSNPNGTLSALLTDVTPNIATGHKKYNTMKLNGIFNSGSTTDSEIERSRTTNIHYIDDDNKNTDISNIVLSGRKNIGTDYIVTIPKGYSLVDPKDGTNYKWNADHTKITYTFVDDQTLNEKNPIVIHLKHKIQDVSATDPNAKQNNRYRMIENLPDGTKKTLIDLEIESHRTATKDLVTGKTTYSDWISKDAVFTNRTNNGAAGDPSFIWKVPLDWFDNCTRTFSIPNGYEKVEQNDHTFYTSPEKDNHGASLIYFISYPDGGVGLDFEFGINNTTTYKAMPANCDFVINYQHNTQNVTDPSQLQTTGKRTITIKMPKGHGDQMTIVQTVGYKRTGILDLYTGKATYTDWVVDADTSNVTVDGQPSTQYQAYVLKDGIVNYAPIMLPHINGYKVKLIQDKANPAMFMVSFVALPQQNNQSASNSAQSSQKANQAEQKQPEPVQTAPATKQTKAGYKPVLQTVRPNMLSFIFMPIAKPPVEVNLDTPEKFSANDATVSLLPTWHLVENNMPDYTYTLTNTINSLNLPKIKDYKLYLVNKDSQDNTVVFTYLKDNNLKYLFKITFINNSFEFSVKNVDKDVIRVYKFNNLKDLDKFLVKFVTAA